MVKTERIQALNLELMQIASFNDFDGEQVVKDLKANRDLWRGAVMDRGAYSAAYQYSKEGMKAHLEPIDLIKLRDIQEGWNVDTLYIRPVIGREKDLEMLARTWGADEVSWIAPEKAQTLLGGTLDKVGDFGILRVWWD